MSQDPACHIAAHGFRLWQVILALEHCFRVRPDARSHGGATPKAAFRADCHYMRGDTMRVDLNLAEGADGDVVLVVTAFNLEK